MSERFIEAMKRGVGSAEIQELWRCYSNPGYGWEQNGVIFHNYVLYLVCQHGKLDFVKILCESELTDWTAVSNCALIESCKQNQLEVVEFLCSDPASKQKRSGRVDVSMVADKALQSAWRSGSFEVFKHLWNHPRVHISTLAGFTIKNIYQGNDAVKVGRLKMVKYLMQNLKINLMSPNHELFKFACSNGDVELVRFLCEAAPISHGDMNEGFYFACKYGHEGVVEFLCECQQIQKYAFDKGFRIACERGKIHVILHLCWHVDLTVHICAALNMAFRSGDKHLLKFLMRNEHLAKAPVCDGKCVSVDSTKFSANVVNILSEMFETLRVLCLRRSKIYTIVVKKLAYLNGYKNSKLQVMLQALRVSQSTTNVIKKFV